MEGIDDRITLRDLAGDGVGYAVDTSTVLGNIDTGKVATHPSAARTITAKTVAGSITVVTVGR